MVMLCITCFAATVPIGVIHAIDFFDHVDVAEFKSPPESNLHWSNREAVVEWNRGAVVHAPQYILVRSVPRCASLLDDANRTSDMLQLTGAVSAAMSQPDVAYVIPTWRGYFAGGYRSWALMGGCRNDTTVFVLNVVAGSDQIIPRVNDFLTQYAAAVPGFNQSYTVQSSGIQQLSLDTAPAVKRNMITIDAISVPLGLVLFAFATRSSPALILVPVLSIASVAGLSLGAASIIHRYMSVTVFSAELMACIVIALSIDFALFLICRIRQIRSARTGRRASNSGDGYDAEDPPRCACCVVGRRTFLAIVDTHDAYLTVLHNISISGTAITACFFCLAFLPFPFVRSIAIVCALGSFFSLVAGLTLIPCLTIALLPLDDLCRELVLWLGSTCATVVKDCRRPPAATGHRATDGTPSDDDADFLAAPYVRRSSTSHELELTTVPRITLWGRCARNAARFWPIVLFASGALTAGFLYVAIIQVVSPERWSINVFMNIPQRSADFRSYTDVIEAFGGEVDTPLTFMFASNSPGNATSLPLLGGSCNYFEAIRLVTDCLVGSTNATDGGPSGSGSSGFLPAALGVERTSIDSPALWRGEPVSCDQFAAAVATYNNGAAAAPYLPGVASATEQQLEATSYWNLLVYLAGGVVDPTSVNFAVVSARIGAGQSAWGAAAALMDEATYSVIHDCVLPALASSPFNATLTQDGNVSAGDTRLYLRVGYGGPNTNEWLIMRDVRSVFGLQMGLSLGAVVLCIALWFRSIFAAVQLLVTTVMTAAIAFGATVLLLSIPVGRDSAFGRSVWPAWPMSGDVLFWLVIVLAFSVSVVLSVDYGVFILSRIAELKGQGSAKSEFDDESTARRAGMLDPEDPIARSPERHLNDLRQSLVAIGLENTLTPGPLCHSGSTGTAHVTDVEACIAAIGTHSHVISYAALIMAVTFLGLLFANTFMLNQFGLILAVTVVVDAFFVRPVVLPAMIAALPDGAVFFPRRVG